MSSNCTLRPLLPYPDAVAQKYIFPPQACAAILVIYFSLRRLYEQTIRNVGRFSISMIAVCEFLLLMCFIPLHLATHTTFNNWPLYREFYQYNMVNIFSMTNLISALQSFFLVAVVIEFYLFTKNSTLTKLFNSVHRQVAIYAIIILFAITVTSYNFVQFKMVLIQNCNVVPMFNQNLAKYISIYKLNVMQYVITVCLPSIVVLVVNHRLARCIRQKSLLPSECKELINEPCTDIGAQDRILRYISMLTVCFVVPHLLSFIPFAFDNYQSGGQITYPPHILKMMSFANAALHQLTVASKTAIFFLLCRISVDLSKLGVVNVY